MSQFLEVRQYTIESGLRARFHERFVQRSLPQLQQMNIDVIAFGASPHDGDCWYLVLAFPDLAALAAVEDALGTGDECAGFSTVILPADPRTIAALRGPAGSDEAVLRALNQQYVDAFMNADAAWYQAHLDGSFVCIESDGSVLDKDQFVRASAKGPDVAAYRLEDVDVRFAGGAGDLAQVVARGVWSRRDGSKGVSLYIDTWMRREGSWRAISAQITRRQQ
jgi:hypothetical protein